MGDRVQFLFLFLNEHSKFKIIADGKFVYSITEYMNVK